MSVKNDLRKELLKRRKAVKDKHIKDKIIQDKLLSLKEYKHSKLILLYASLDDEISTDNLVLDALESGKCVALPRCIDKNGNMSFYIINSFKDLEIGNFNVREPKKNCEVVTDFSDSLCVVPALSFDRTNYRIGYGKGYYDRFLQNNNCFSVGLCYNELMSEKLPVDEYDKSVDIVLTD